MPSNAAAGPVIPSRASEAANTPARAADAVALPFHIESSPARVWRVGTLLLTAIDKRFGQLLRRQSHELAGAGGAAQHGEDALVPASLP